MKRVIPFLPWIGALLLVAFALIAYESDLLWKVQQYNLFLDTSLFFRGQMLVPGGLLSYVSCYFTQFFFHPWLGVLMLCGWWLLLMWLVKRAFCISESWTVLALIPVALLLVANMDLGYWHYFMRLQGYFFVPSIGTTAAVALLWAFRKLSCKWWLRLVCILLTAVVGYPLIGVYALAATLLMGVWIWRLSDLRTQNALISAAALLCVIAVPLLCYRFIYYQTNIQDLWTMALPNFTAIESHPQYYIPFYILGMFFLLMVLATKSNGDKVKILPNSKRQVPQILVQGAFMLLLVVLVWHYWYKDDNFRHELVMQHCIDQSDWEGVIREGLQQGDVEPTRPIVMMYNLALSRLGRQLDEMYNFPKGKKRSKTPLPYNMLYHVFGSTIYYQYGLLNDSHRRCLEDGVEYGWRVGLLKDMCRCYLLSGETHAARKMIDLLRHTRYHGQWADNMQRLLDHPEQIAQDREAGPVSHMLHYKNALGGDGGDVEKYVMSLLASQDSDDPLFQEQAVIGALWMRNPRQYLARFGQYARLHPQGPMPRIFQEGTYLFGKLEKVPDIDRYPFDKGVKESYNAFMKEAAKYDNQAVEIGRTALYPFYGNTYYYEYYFLKNSH